MKLSDLKAGQYFRFTDWNEVYQARGNSWWGTLEGYDGGPWHGPKDRLVTLYECKCCGENDCSGCEKTGQNLACFV